MSERNGGKTSPDARAAKESGFKMARDQRREAKKEKTKNKSPPRCVRDRN
jgi:hypothetical protein